MVRVGSFLAFGLWTTCFVACGAFEIEDSGGFGDGGRAGAGADAGVSPDAAAVKQPQGQEHRPEGCGASDTPAMNAACIDEASGVFVDSAMVAEGNGSKASPFNTITSAIAALDGAGETRHWLYLAKGTYPEPIVDDQRSLKFFGGLQHASNSEWSAGAPGDVSFVQPSVGPALVVTNILDSSWFEDLDFTAGAVPSDSLSSVAALLVTAGASDRPLVFRRVGFHAGGARGGPPALVVEEPTCGAQGEGAAILAPGSGHSCTCADGTNVSGGDGARLYRSARNGSPAELGGAAGKGSCEDGTSTPGGPGQTAAGEPTIGADADTEGVLGAADWVPKDANPGARGAHGGGGGGGATGKYGAGGGGGSGACGGRGGGAGRGGGGSFGVLGLTAFLDFQGDVTITTAGGGNGSVGGRPGDARGGGGGGSQGVPGACGGMNGGQGGAGTAGAAGGGGAGGPSIAVLIRGAVTGSQNLTRPRNGALGGEWPGGALRGRTADIVEVDASGVLPSL